MSHREPAGTAKCVSPYCWSARADGQWDCDVVAVVSPDGAGPAALRAQPKDIALTPPCYGHRRVHVLLRC